MYLNLVEGRLWVPAVAGSNPATPTNSSKPACENGDWRGDELSSPRYCQRRGQFELHAPMRTFFAQLKLPRLLATDALDSVTMREVRKHYTH